MLALRRRWLKRWWVITLTLWASVGVVSIWSLRRTWQQLADYFTWAALRYGLAFNRLAAIGLGLCLGLKVALLIEPLCSKLIALHLSLLKGMFYNS